MHPRFATGHLVVALRSPRIVGRNFEAGDSIPFPPRFPAYSMHQIRSCTLGLVVKSLIASLFWSYSKRTVTPGYAYNRVCKWKHTSTPEQSNVWRNKAHYCKGSTRQNLLRTLRARPPNPPAAI